MNAVVPSGWLAGLNALQVAVQLIDSSGLDAAAAVDQTGKRAAAAAFQE